MVFRKAIPRFCFRNTRTNFERYIVNEPNKTFNDFVYPQLPFKIPSQKAKVKCRSDNTPKGQLYNLTLTMTRLFMEERIEVGYNRAAGVRAQAERLIVEAMRNGDRHKPTMALANYWLRDKSMVHKLFKVFVPRYSNYATSFTAFHMLGKDYERAGWSHEKILSSRISSNTRGDVILEMRGNNLPPIIRPRLDRSDSLTNVLIDCARLSLRESNQMRPTAS